MNRGHVQRRDGNEQRLTPDRPAQPKRDGGDRQHDEHCLNQPHRADHPHRQRVDFGIAIRNFRRPEHEQATHHPAPQMIDRICHRIGDALPQIDIIGCHAGHRPLVRIGDVKPQRPNILPLVDVVEHRRRVFAMQSRQLADPSLERGTVGARLVGGLRKLVLQTAAPATLPRCFPDGPSKTVGRRHRESLEVDVVIREPGRKRQQRDGDGEQPAPAVAKAVYQHRGAEQREGQQDEHRPGQCGRRGEEPRRCGERRPAGLARSQRGDDGHGQQECRPQLGHRERPEIWERRECGGQRGGADTEVRAAEAPGQAEGPETNGDEDKRLGHDNRHLVADTENAVDDREKRRVAGRANRFRHIRGRCRGARELAGRRQRRTELLIAALIRPRHRPIRPLVNDVCAGV